MKVLDIDQSTYILLLDMIDAKFFDVSDTPPMDWNLPLHHVILASLLHELIINLHPCMYLYLPVSLFSTLFKGKINKPFCLENVSNLPH